MCHPHEFGDGDRALLRPDAPPSPETLMYSNWDDSGGTEEISYVIERPMFAMNEWRDYDGDSIYADWTVDLAAVDPNGLPAPALQHLRTYLGGVSFATSGAATAVYVHGDHLGSARAFTNNSATLVGQRFFNAWGGLEATTGSVSTRYGYVGAQGYQTDAATGLMHLGARYYDPRIGRFLQRDPIGIGGGSNVYAYARNEPTRRSDPSGLFDEWEGAKWFVAGCILAGIGLAVTAATAPVSIPTGVVVGVVGGSGVVSGVAGGLEIEDVVRAFEARGQVQVYGDNWTGKW